MSRRVLHPSDRQRGCHRGAHGFRLGAIAARAYPLPKHTRIVHRPRRLTPLLASRGLFRRARARLGGPLGLRRARLPRLLRGLRAAREEGLGRAAEGERALLRRAAARLGALLGGVLDAVPLLLGGRGRDRAEREQRAEDQSGGVTTSAAHSSPPSPGSRATPDVRRGARCGDTSAATTGAARASSRRGRATSTPPRAARRPRARWRRTPGSSRARGPAASVATRRGEP